MKSIKVFILLFFLIFTHSILYGQQAIVASGGDINNGVFSFSVGQISHSEFNSTNGAISHGLQVYEISIINEIESVRDHFDLSVYPNPTTDEFHLQAKKPLHDKLYYHLYDHSGNLLQSSEVKNGLTKFEMAQLPASVYFLKISSDQEIGKIFKIIKN